MKTILRLAVLTVSCSPMFAVPVTWFLNNVTFTDGGRAFGSFTLETATGAFSAINIQTTPASSTTSASSAVGGGNYTNLLTTSPFAFVSGGVANNVRRLQILPSPAGLAGTAPVQLTGTEGFCNTACNALVGSQSRSIATGQIVRASPAAPVTWYMIATLVDGSQMVGSFDFDAVTNGYSNVDISITPGTTFPSGARLKFSRAGAGSATVGVFQADQTVKDGTRVIVVGSPTSLATAPAGTSITLLNSSYEGVCPPATTPNCAVVNPLNIVFGSIVNFRPAGYSKVVSQVADGGGWSTTLILTNTSDGPVPYGVTFAQDDGTPFEVSGITSWTAGTVPPGGVAYLTSANAGALNQGSATIIGGHNLSVSAVFTQKNANPSGDQQGSVDGDTQGAVSFSVPFDNTAGAVGGFALTNNSLSTVTVLAVAYDETGKILLVDNSLTLPANGHTAFAFGSRPAFAPLAGKRGLLRLFAIHPGATPPYPGLNGLLLKFLPNNSFTTIGVNNQ